MCYLRVFERKTGRRLGFLVDITPGGAKLISESPLMTGDYKLMMELPPNMFNDREYLNLDACAVWCDHDISPQFYNTGFQLLNLQADDNVVIDKLIEVYKFRRDQETMAPGGDFLRFDDLDTKE
jgi:hypothetical protein